MTSTSTELTTALHALPQQWALTPVNQKKAHFAGWQQTGLSRESIEQEITSGKADGFGILTGELSGGLIAIDCDGHEPHARFREILGGEILATVSFASGRDGRAQYLYSVPQKHWASIQSKVENTSDGQLDFRWNGRYSVLPPSAHPETDGYCWVKSPDDCPIAQLPEKALEHLLNLCKPKVSTAKPAPKKADNVPPIPLERCLSKDHREALINGVGEGGRSNTAISLGRDLLGCAAWLDALNEPYGGDPQSLYIEYCDRCSPPINDRERDATWRSANKYSPEPSISDAEAFQNCIDKWKREHGVTVIERPVESNTTPLMDDVIAAVTNLSGAGLTAELAGIAKKHDRPVSSIEKMATQIHEEIDRTSDDGGELRRLLTAQDFDPISSLADPLRGMLAAEATRWSLPTIGYVASLLTVALSVTKTTTRLWAMNTEGKPVIWLGLVGTSNSGKSESLNTITRPLEDIQNDASQEFETKLLDFEKDQAEFEEAKKSDKTLKPPQEPICKEYYLIDYTYESIGRTLKDQKDDCLLLKLDELKPFFNFDRYSTGGGNRARFLTFYDGGELKINRKGKDDKRVHVPKTGISIIGTTQHSTLANMLKEDPNMEDGLWARFCLVNLPTTPTYAHEPERNGDLFNRLKGVYAEIRGYEAQNFTLSTDAKLLWSDWYNELVDSSIAQGSDFLGSIYGKSKDRAARVALALHLVNAAVDRSQPTSEVSAETMASAIDINRYLLAETEKCLGLVGATTTQEESRVMKFVTKFDGDEYVTTERVKDWWTTKPKPPRQACRDFMKYVVDQGLASSNQLQHTDPKYQIKVISSRDRSPRSPLTLKPINRDALSPDDITSPGIVRSSPPSPEVEKSLETRTTPDYQQTNGMVCPQSVTEKEIQAQRTTRTTNQEEIENIPPSETPDKELLTTTLLGEIENEF
jgi:Protein of unknown function (DUF3987)/Bifunctional DNA primase/polymerase, N-terminal